MPKSSKENYHDFIRYWCKEGVLDRSDSVHRFRAEVNYFFKGQSRYLRCDCYAHLDGKVHLFADKDDWLDVDKHYTEFNTDYQVFRFTKSGKVKIEGSGPKIGEYWLSINPVVPET